MNYQQAKSLRQTSLKNLIIHRTVSGQGFLRSVRSSISDKTKAKLVGIKEKFDFMNVGKAIGGRLGAYAIGRMTGRSGEDMSYFTGAQYGRYGKRTDRTTPVAVQKKNNPLYTKISAAEQRPSKKGDGLADVLARIFNLMKKTSDENKKRLELDKDFEHGREGEREKRHKELLKALTGLSGGPATSVTPKTGGLFGDLFKNLMKTVEELKELIGPLKDFLKKIGKSGLQGLTRLLGALGTGAALPILMGTAAAIALGYLALKAKEDIEANPNDPKYKDNPYARVVRGEAATKGEAAKQIEREGLKKFSYQYIKQLVESKLTDEELVSEYGADRPTLKKWLVENPKTAEFQAPVPSVTENTTKNVTPASTAGAGRGSVNPTLPSATPMPITPNGGRGSVNPTLPTETPSNSVTPVGSPSLTPMSSAPSGVSTRMQAAVAENKNLELNQSTSPAVVIDKSKTIASGGSPEPAISLDSSAVVRIDDPTLKYIIKSSTRLV